MAPRVKESTELDRKRADVGLIPNQNVDCSCFPTNAPFFLFWGLTWGTTLL